MIPEPAIIYITPDKALFFTIPKRRHINSYPAEVLALLGYSLREADEEKEMAFDEDDYLLQMNLRVYSSASKKSDVLVRHTIKPNDFSAIPQNSLEQLGSLSELSITSKTDDLTVIREIITKGYVLSPSR